MHKCTAPTPCRHTVSGTFHSPSGVLFAFPSRYLFTIGCQVVFSLTRWFAHIHTGFHLSRATLESVGFVWLVYRAFTFFGSVFQTDSISPHNFHIRVQNPQEQVLGFGLFRFRSPLLTESLRFLFLRLLRCFTSAGIALTGLFNSTGSNWV